MLDRVSALAREASALMRCEFSVEQKGNNSNYVTSADRAVQEFLAERLPQLVPGSEVLGEEGDAPVPTSEYIWVIDPIDGTSNFTRGIGLSVISIALTRNREPVLAVIYEPTRDELFSAEAGKGAFLNGVPMRVSDRDFAHSHLCSAMSLYDKRYAPPCFRIIEEVYLQSDDLRRLGSAALELAYLAAGRVELFFEIRLFPWDAMAGLLLVREAGGFAESLYCSEIPHDRPFPVAAANSRENFMRLCGIVQRHVPTIPYEERSV